MDKFTRAYRSIIKEDVDGIDEESKEWLDRHGFALDEKKTSEVENVQVYTKKLVYSPGFMIEIRHYPKDSSELTRWACTIVFKGELLTHPKGDISKANYYGATSKQAYSDAIFDARELLESAKKELTRMW